MTLVLETPRDHGGWRVAALCEQTLVAHSGRGRLAFGGRKRPVAILLYDGGTVAAVDLAGRTLDLDRLEARCPGLTRVMTGAREGA